MNSLLKDAASIYRKLVFGNRAESPGATWQRAEHGAAAQPTGALPRGVSGGEDFARDDAETA